MLACGMSAELVGRAPGRLAVSSPGRKARASGPVDDMVFALEPKDAAPALYQAQTAQPRPIAALPCRIISRARTSRSGWPVAVWMRRLWPGSRNWLLSHRPVCTASATRK